MNILPIITNKNILLLLYEAARLQREALLFGLAIYLFIKNVKCVQLQ